MKWSVEETCKLIELYRENECLWNINSINYRNKNMRRAAEEDLVRHMGKEGFGVAELKQKIKIMRCTYNQEVLKIQRSKTSGSGSADIYVPSVKWFNTMDTILRNLKGINETQTTTVETMLREEQEEEERAVDEPQNTSIESQETRTVTRGVRAHEDGRTPKSSSGKQKGRKRRLDELSEAVKELNRVNHALSPDDSYVNENEAFGKFVALSLQKMSVYQAVLAQSDIHAVLTRYRLAALPTSSSPAPSCRNVYSPSHSPSNFSNESSYSTSSMSEGE